MSRAKGDLRFVTRGPVVKVLRAVGDRGPGDALSDRGRVGWHGRELSEARLSGVEPVVVEVSADLAVNNGIHARLVRLRSDLRARDI
jgi:hypothetical protein